MALTRGYLVDDSRGRHASYPVLSSSTFKQGDLLIFDSSGRLEQPVAGGSILPTANPIVGGADGPATNDQGLVYASQSVTIWEPLSQWVFALYSATPASAVFNPNMLGLKYGLIMVTSGGDTFVCVNFDDTTNTMVRLVNVLTEDYPGWPAYNGAGTTQYPKVIVEALAASSELSGTRS